MTSRLKYFTALLAFLIILTPFSQSAHAADDITGHWHEEALLEMIELKVMNGYGNGEYRPDAQVTRGQFAAIISRALNLETPTEGKIFTDVKSENDFLNEVLAASNAEIITGYTDGTFKPHKVISRVHMAVITERAMKYLQIEEKSTNLQFADVKKILADYRPAVANTVAYEIFKGSPIDGKLFFRPEDNASRGDAAAIMSRLLKVAKAAQPEEPEAEPVLTYDVATAASDGTHKVIRKFDTFEAAEAFLKAGNGNAVYYDNAIVRMNSGVVITVPLPSDSLTTVYATTAVDAKGDTVLRNAFTYVSADTELEYYGSTKDYVQVRVSGKDGFIRHQNANLKLWSQMTGRSYYSVSGGNLNHHIYSNAKNSYSAYSIGKAPSFMSAGQRYHSWDGIEFLTTGGKVAGRGYNYFQYLPARSTTSYTAAEIDAYIVKRLLELEANNPSSTTYKDASKRSKLIGMGTHLKKVEAESGINALMILALAQHESAYGLSARAVTFNNLFGLRVYDNNPANDHFATVEENIDELISLFWNKNYIPPNAVYANGSNFGSKAIGMNMRYASDPFWGSKAAGHMYRIDQAMGGKELFAYELGLTTAINQNARTSAEVLTNNVAFTYKAAGYPVILKEALKKPDRTWYRTSSDDLRFPEVYFAGEYIRPLSVLK
ncbi:S-layer homology domain-containing protein [Planococcus sp. CAU13]|uniref:S-layer homology domain-containing protein n=1 Tax=Planococcus sp. CAU13 TaxID=1541197 RepID=UPI00052FE533|nr:S-layer homology domain-containing protein [Planococcus sp. CAU13]